MCHISSILLVSYSLKMQMENNEGWMQVLKRLEHDYFDLDVEENLNLP